MKMNLRSWYSGGAFLARIQKQICNLRSYGLFTIKEMEDPKKRIIAMTMSPLCAPHGNDML